MIKRIVLEIIEQAQKLKSEMDKLFGKEKEYVPYYPNWWHTTPGYPYQHDYISDGTLTPLTIVRVTI